MELIEDNLENSYRFAKFGKCCVNCLASLENNDERISQSTCNHCYTDQHMRKKCQVLNPKLAKIPRYMYMEIYGKKTIGSNEKTNKDSIKHFFNQGKENGLITKSRVYGPSTPEVPLALELYGTKDQIDDF